MSRFSSIAEDGGSGRSGIYREVLQIQAESDIWNWIIGNGYNTVAQKTSQLLSAHNDWQEVLYDYGLVGLFIYITLHLLLVQKIRSLVQSKNEYAPVLAMSYVMFLLMSLTSHLIIYPTYFLYLVALWGAIFAITHQQSQELPQGGASVPATVQRLQSEALLVPSRTGRL
jgi:O-antigen ligase